MSFTPAEKLQTEKLKQCPICNHLESTLVLSQPDGYIPMLQLNRCLNCQIVYLNPRLHPEATIVVEDESEVYSFSKEIADLEWAYFEQLDLLISDEQARAILEDLH